MTEEVGQRTLEMEAKDRFVVLSELPQESNLLDQLLARDIRKKVEFTPTELEEIEFKQDGINLGWNEKKTSKKVVPFTEAELNLIDRMFKDLSSRNRVSVAMVDTILKFQQITGA